MTKRKEPFPVQCIVCGTWFWTARKQQRYCWAQRCVTKRMTNNSVTYRKRHPKRWRITINNWKSRNRKHVNAYANAMYHRQRQDPAWRERRNNQSRIYLIIRYATNAAFAESRRDYARRRKQTLFDQVDQEITANPAAHADEVLAALQQLVGQQESEHDTTRTTPGAASSSDRQTKLPRYSRQATRRKPRR